VTRTGGRRTAALAAAVVAAVFAAVPADAAIPAAPEPTVTLPGDVTGAANASRTWIVGARPGAGTAAIARRHGATALGVDGAYVIARDRARTFAQALRRTGVLTHAEPDVAATRTSAWDSDPFGWARGAVVAPGLAPPPPTGRIGVVDTFVDASHPDLAGQVVHLPGSPGTVVVHPHGTMVASAAAGAFNGFGVTGVYPGAQIVNYAVTPDLRCSDSVNGIVALARERVAVIVTSYGFTRPCYAEYQAIAVAYGVGSLVVAAAGNEFQQGNPVSWPAAWPHVVSVASTGPGGASSFFSSANASIDVAAPGESVPLAIPLALDVQDGAQDGVTVGTGTSFSAPIVAGAVAWLRTARPEITNGQAADLLRRTAIDLGPEGWDRNNGYGLVNMQGALTAAVPPIDPLEPNDSIAEVDGTIFEGADPPIWSGRGRRVLRAEVDSVEDPIDVYRVRIPARTRWQAVLRPRSRRGDPDLEVYRGAAKSLSQARHSVARSVRGRGRTDAVTVVNRRRSARTMYVIVYVPRDERYHATGYSLRLLRRAYR